VRDVGVAGVVRDDLLLARHPGIAHGSTFPRPQPGRKRRIV
jgi:hypothetical protein